MKNINPSIKKSPNACQFEISSLHVEDWYKKGLLPEHLYTYFKQSCKRTNSHQPETVKSLDRFRAEMELQVEFYHFIVDNWEELANSLKSSKLFDAISSPETFGVPRGIADPVIHMTDILEKAILVTHNGNAYSIKGSKTNSKGDQISLTYGFEASSVEEAKRIKNIYVEKIKTAAIKAWLTCWKYASDNGSFHFSARLSDIMQIQKEGSRSKYNTKEKSTFYESLRFLQRTRIKITFKGSKKFIEQPLIEICGGEETAGNTTPTTLSIRLLNTDFIRHNFAPAAISNSTLDIHPKRIFLMLWEQIRADQQGRGSKNISLDLDRALQLANLDGIANKRQSKKRLIEALRTGKKDKIIKNFTVDKSEITIEPIQHKRNKSVTLREQKCNA